MKASELIDRLAASGTGTGKLVALREALQANPKATAADLLAACDLPSGTVAKARAIMGDAPADPPAPPAESKSPASAAGGESKKSDTKDKRPAAAGSKGN